MRILFDPHQASRGLKDKTQAMRANGVHVNEENDGVYDIHDEMSPNILSCKKPKCEGSNHKESC